MTTKTTRVERDSMGPMEVPDDAYYGASTQRALLNFPISDVDFPRSFIRSLGLIKQAAAHVNRDLGLLTEQKAQAIAEAASDVADGKFDDHFVVDIYQTGSGTSTNMNANEVIANRANELLGERRGARLVHPNDEVNMGQSSNDVFPTAIHLAAIMSIKDELIPSLLVLQESLEAKSEEFWPVLKTGRTHLQDATPIRLGQEFQGFAGQVARSIRRLGFALDEMSEVALGGTAVGTGINTHPEFASRVCAWLSDVLQVTIRETDNHFQAQNTLDGVVVASGILRAVAISLMKVANDIRLMGSGPRAGYGELAIPEVQPGSSIMPGKVNPVIAESLIMAGAQVIGNDLTVATSGQWGYFELNTMMPVAALNLLQAIALLSAVARNFAIQCVQGLTATDHGPRTVEQGLAMATALAPEIGYDAAAQIAKEAAKRGATVREVALEQRVLPEEKLNEVLNPEEMTRPGHTAGPAGG
jgi:fumarate hydratase, class II